jgi:hypothetical protein
MEFSLCFQAISRRFGLRRSRPFRRSTYATSNGRTSILGVLFDTGEATFAVTAERPVELRIPMIACSSFICGKRIYYGVYDLF